MIVIADTTPINYLVLIGHIDVLEQLYGQVLIPNGVYQELQAVDSPDVVKDWITHHPSWIEVHQVKRDSLIGLENLDMGEAEAIVLAEQLHADALIIDERDGRREAIKRKLRVIGTLRVLSDAAAQELIDLESAFSLLRSTSFRAAPEIFQYFLDLESERKRLKDLS
jgi:predicted nucleic acid-binding protein